MQLRGLRNLRTNCLLPLVVPVTGHIAWGVGIAQWLELTLVMERSPVRVLVGAKGEFSSPGSAFCADSYFGICYTPVLLQ